MSRKKKKLYTIQPKETKSRLVIDQNKLNRQKAYYNIDFKGVPNDSIKKEIWNKIKEIKKIEITHKTKNQDIYILGPTKSTKLNQYLSKNQSQGTKITGNNEKTVYKNATISMIVNNLNEWYSEKFCENNC